MEKKKECPRYIPREKEPMPEAASGVNDGLGGLKPSAYLAWRCQWQDSEAAAYSAWKEIQYLHAGLDRYREALEKIASKDGAWREGCDNRHWREIAREALGDA